MGGRRIFLLVLCVVMGLGAAGLPARAKQVRVGVYDNKPMIFMGESGPEGLFIDVLEHIAGQENWAIEYRHGQWETVFGLVKKGEIDILPVVALKERRRQYLDYNRDVILSNWGVVYTRKNLKVNSILDLSGRRIAIQPNDTHGEYFTGLLGKLNLNYTRVETANYIDILKKLSAQECDAGVVNFINSTINAPRFDVQITPIVFNPVEIHYAVPKGDPASLLGGMDRHVESLKADPDSIYHRSMEKWFGVGLPDGAVIPVWLKWGIGVAGAVVALSFTGNLILRRHIRVKTRALVLELEKRRQAEEELRFQALMLNNIQDHVTATDLDGNIVYVNETEIRTLKRDRTELLNASVDVFGENTAKGASQAEIIEKTLENGAWRGEVVNYASDGSEIIMDCRTQLIKDENHKPWRMVGISTDITDKKRSEAEKELLLTAIEQFPETVVITDAKGNIQYINSAFERLTGYPRDALIGQNPRVLKSGSHDPDFYRQMWETITRGGTWKGNITNRKKDGTLFTEETSISPVHNDSGAIVNYVAVKRDISDELKLKRQLVQARKMETIGTLAGGIAHDFNNILFPILGHTEILQADIPRAEEGAHESLKQIYDSGLRAKSLVRQILTFSRQENTEFKPLKIQMVLKEVIRLLRSTIPKNIEIRQWVDPCCSAVYADATQIHQIIMNLATNACHAMGDDGGELAIRLRETDISSAEADELGILTGNYVRLVVTDTGVGMTPDLAEKVFEPFFTTKEKGKGTGMGLAVVHGIVENMKGRIRVRTESGRGTEFQVYFPVNGGEIQEDHYRETKALGGTETILLVDDEEAILKMEKQALERLGYQVVASTSPMEAMRIFGRTPDEFSLVMTDMAMPGMSGEKLAEGLLKRRPDIPIIICTGFSETLTPETARLMGLRDVVMKPVILKELSQKIREVLDNPSPVRSA